MEARPKYRKTSSYHSPAKQTLKTCPLCLQAKRGSSNHFLSMCPYLPEQDKKFMSRARQVLVDSDIEDVSDSLTAVGPISSRGVQVDQSPYLDTFYQHHHVRVTIDSGSETNMISHSLVLRLVIPVTKSTQHATQADGQTKLKIVGETRFELFRDTHILHLTALVVESMDVDLLGGTTFMSVNDVSVRPARVQVMIGEEIYKYGPSEDNKSPVVRRTQASVLRSTESTTIWPGQFIEVKLPANINQLSTVAIEPRLDSAQTNDHTRWPEPAILQSVGGKIRIPNATDLPVVIRRNSHFSQVVPVFTPESHNILPTPNQKLITPVVSSPVLSFEVLLKQYEQVFSPSPTGYNGAFGPFTAKVNKGPVLPPQRKGRIPQYSKDKLDDLQTKFDELEALGIFRKPEILDLSKIYYPAQLNYHSKIVHYGVRPNNIATISVEYTLVLSKEPTHQKTVTNVNDVKRNLQNVTIAADGTLVVRKTDPLTPIREVIVIPRELLQGLITALHIRLNHPSSYQMRLIVKRYLYALDIDQSVDRVKNQCHACK
ncbi:hypothetical protein LOTGIDRAFT_164058 [Lottia gigantea]|uniref:Uncharacterized protein n=1 Tax=Lottia gigantea TaxID=225164 RepID=V4AB10_LOTGI|nr:hypothetical protein LOTGIDRAFT_164058 [Lottia gigantea]ESO90481.1 hypothetical protein LOTGIDRAFT_164058 [Lottia gigantea]